MFLSSKGLKNIVCDDSTFIFNVNGRPFTTSKFKAQFISPKVSRLLQSDATQDLIELNSPNGSDYFEGILSLCNGDSICIESSRIPAFISICQSLENEELISLIIDQNPISTTNICWRLKVWMKDSDVGFGCENFDKLNHSSLSIDILERLLSDSRLKIESEDRLFEIIESLIIQDESFFILLDYIKCEYLSSKSISRFISLISIENLSSGIWSSICRFKYSVE
jgi:hypothetical protein